MRRTEMMWNGVALILVLCALSVTALVARRELGARPTPSTEITHIDDWKSLASAGAVMGPVNAPVTIIEFSDFQCPYCARLQPRLQSAHAKYPGRFRVIYRHLPIASLHPFATQAAEVAECAGEQGRFAAMHDALYAAQAAIGQRPWKDFAVDAAVRDTDGFEKCLTSHRYAKRVASDVSTARALGIRGTPTLIINGRVLRGLPDSVELDRLLRP
jgi:protein-disulfide isomerase